MKLPTRKKWKFGDVTNLELTNYTFFDYFTRLELLALNMFEWINLPSSIDERFLELALFEDGQVLFFKDKELDIYLVQRVTATGPFSVYDIPTKRRTYSVSGYKANRNNKDSVIIYNNYIRTPTIYSVQMFASRLTNIERSRDINLANTKTPYILLGDQKTKLSLTNMYQRFTGNEPLMIVSKDFEMNNLQSVDLNVPFISQELTDIKNSIWNEALTYLGIGNPSRDKKERLITSEVESNTEVIESSRSIFLTARKQACKQINEMFGLNIDVRYRHTDMNLADKTQTMEMEMELNE